MILGTPNITALGGWTTKRVEGRPKQAPNSPHSWAPASPKAHDAVGSPMRAIAVSDVHLGWSQSNDARFRAFLDGLPTLDYFLVLGDFFEMWRRDMVRVMIEHRDVLDRLQALKQRCRVVLLAGNHDMHLHTMGQGYPAPFEWALEHRIPVGARTYVFRHGHQYDPSCQNEALDESLCHTNDVDGAHLAKLGGLTGIGQKPSFTARVAAFSRVPLANPTILQRLSSPGLRRDSANLAIVRTRARASIKPGEFLVHGHTHVGLLEANYADTGSWVEGDATYVQIQDLDVQVLTY